MGDLNNYKSETSISISPRYMSFGRSEQVYVLYKYEYVYMLLFELMKNSDIYYCYMLPINE